MKSMDLILATGAATTVVSIVITLATAYLRSFMAAQVATLEIHLIDKVRGEFAGKELLTVELRELARRMMVQEDTAIGTGGRVDKLEQRVTEHGHQINSNMQELALLARRRLDAERAERERA